jgi:hypothetical protein
MTKKGREKIKIDKNDQNIIQNGTQLHCGEVRFLTLILTLISGDLRSGIGANARLNFFEGVR